MIPNPKLVQHSGFLLTKTYPFAVNCIPLSLEDTVKFLKLSADTRSLRFGERIHAHLIVTNRTTPGDVISINSLINFYAKCGEIFVSRQLFDGMCKRNVVSWNSLMAGYFHNGLASEALNLFKKMISVESFRPNKYILATVLSSCADNETVEEVGIQYHAYVLKSGLLFHQYVKNALIHLYSRCYDALGAIGVLDSLPESDIYSFNSIINGLSEDGYLMEALDLLYRLVGKSLAWDNVTYVTVFGLCSRLRNLKMGLQVHSWMFKGRINSDLHISTSIIDMYGKCGKISNAERVFEKMQTRNVPSWTAIISAYFQNGCFEEALKLLQKMDLDGTLPNEYTFSVLINSVAGLSALKLGIPLHARTEKSGFKDHVVVSNALINMYSKCGNIESANKVFLDMKNRDFITWNSMISGFSHHGLGKEALFVFGNMLAAKEAPNYVTFVGVLSACGHLGLVQEGFYYLNHFMKQSGIEPGVEHYTCIVGLLSKARLLNEAEKFMKNTQVKWDLVAWRTLLSACYVHNNISLGKRVADIVFNMDPNDVGSYILLSNMYAKAKRWDGVVNIRKMMRERSIKKEPGVSWIEIKTKTHVFVSEDNNHPECKMIYEKVGEILNEIKLLGYVADKGNVLHDVEDEQKEQYLSYHSERLAIAYGIMKLPSGATIRVMKNLRMCDDCHVAVKLVSKVTKRVIIVRDANRFHCFNHGVCSCADYW